MKLTAFRLRPSREKLGTAAWIPGPGSAPDAKRGRFHPPPFGLVAQRLYCIELPESPTTHLATAQTLTRRWICSRPFAITALRS
jgi:hypothetical protein